MKLAYYEANITLQKIFHTLIHIVRNKFSFIRIITKYLLQNVYAAFNKNGLF